MPFLATRHSCPSMRATGLPAMFACVQRFHRCRASLPAGCLKWPFCPDPPLEKQEVLTTYTMPHGEIIAGLRAAQASISPKYFYDQQGSALFERITALPEYYPTRTEGAIMQMHGQDIKACIAAAATVIELGAGNCEKARVLCSLVQPRCFVAIDISGDFLHQAVNGLRNAFPALDIRAGVADIFDQGDLPPDLPSGQRLVFYPGSSIGNFDPAMALGLLQRIRGLLANQGALLIGVDLIKDAAILNAASLIRSTRSEEHTSEL